jgi:hypothetical protein
MPSRKASASASASADQQLRAPISLAQELITGDLPQPGQPGPTGRQPASAPASASMITPSPTDVDSTPVDSSPYTLTFMTSSTGSPSNADIVEASEVTRKFLEDFMLGQFANTAFTSLDDFVNELVSYTNGGSPIVVAFTSTARFDPESVIIPQAVQIDESLAMAFADASNFISQLKTLSSKNVFSSTVSVNFSLGPALKVVDPPKNSNGANGAGIAAGAVAATLLLAGLVIYKRRANQEQEESKGVKKTNEAATVAGDTYTGETVSIAASSLDYGGNRYRDEETGGILHLEAIREIYDDSSVTPAWDEGSMNDEGQAYAQAEESNEEDVSQTDDTIESSEASNSQGQDNNTGCTEDDSTISGGTLSSASRSDGEDRSTSYRDPYFDATYNGAKSFDGIDRSTSSDVHSHMGDGEDSLTSHERKSVGGAEPPLQADSASRSIEEGKEGADDASHGNGSSEGQFVSTDSTKGPKPTSSTEIGSHLSYDLDYLQEIEQDSEEQDESEEMFLTKVNDAPPKHRTVEEIESLLSADLDDDESHHTEISFDDLASADDRSTPSQRPRTVSEIESLLSSDLDDDVHMS